MVFSSEMLGQSTLKPDDVWLAEYSDTTVPLPSWIPLRCGDDRLGSAASRIQLPWRYNALLSNATSGMEVGCPLQNLRGMLAVGGSGMVETHDSATWLNCLLPA